MTWYLRIARCLPEVARRAGSGTIAALADLLDEVEDDHALHEAPPERVMARLVPRLTAALRRREREADDLRQTLALARNQGYERAALVEALTRMDAPDLDQDLLALDRHLDAEAIEDRLLLRLNATYQAWEYLARALSAHEVDVLVDDDVISCRDSSVAVFSARRPWPVKVAACRLAGVLCDRPVPGAASARQALLHLAHDEREDPWVQAEALRAWVGVQRDPDAVEQVLRGIALPPPERIARMPADQAFVRARAVRLAAENGAWDILREVLGRPDPSEHVSCTAAGALARSPRAADRGAVVALMSDLRTSQAVRGTAAVSALPDLDHDPEHTDWIQVVGAALDRPDAFVAELAARAVLDRIEHIGGWTRRCRRAWSAALDRWATASEEPDLAVTAATLRMALDVRTDPRLSGALREVQRWIAASREGDTRLFRTGQVADLTPAELLDVLAAAAADGLDLSASPRGGSTFADTAPRRGYRLFHGTADRLAAWRVGYELARLRPDKRQAHRFTTDRVPDGTLIAPSNRMAEVTPTLVPGQRQGTPTRLAWGADLPLPALVLAASRRGGLRVRTAGTAYAVRPKGAALFARARAHWRYVDLAEQRQRLLDGGTDEARSAYDALLDKAGFAVTRAPAFVPLVQLDDLARHVVALDSNTVPQLAVLSGVVLAGWVGRNLFRRRIEDHWRAQIPLVVGGWGSRGKSGTERLKAAVFHGLGYSVLSKTTGCEAMVVSGIPGREPTEIFLYRPYDKATIFEQREVLRLAAAMRPQVLLWECMALNPTYVQLLQQDWMRDDLTTITNTYPDHEDIQGPTGRDVADVIGKIIPRRGAVLTSEQHMAPVLAQRARDMGSTLDVVRPEDWRLLPRDLLARLPYNEHPRNVALVARLAERLGIERDVALRAMADHVVPDLGVLKEYGPCDYDGRNVSFVNGMSANERAGFLSNWRRMGFGVSDEASGLDEAVIVVVNNRADRLARQEVFARIAALDIAADALLVIGTNVQSFHLAWKRALRRDLRPRLLDMDRDRLRADIARRLRRAPRPRDAAIEAVISRGLDPTNARAWADPFWSDEPLDDVELDLYRADALGPEGRSRQHALRQWLREVSWLHRLEHEEWSREAAIDNLISLLEARARPLTNPALSGDQVVHQVVTTVGPQMTVRVLGSCNIKGTGLEFVYRWLSVDKVGGLCDAVGNSAPEPARDALRALVAHTNYGVADSRLVLGALAEHQASGRLQALGVEESATRLVERLRHTLTQTERGLKASAQLTRWQRVRRWIRGALDFWDSVARRREADALYADLAARRVGQDHAAKVAKELVYRGKT